MTYRYPPSLPTSTPYIHQGHNLIVSWVGENHYAVTDKFQTWEVWSTGVVVNGKLHATGFRVRNMELDKELKPTGSLGKKLISAVQYKIAHG